MYAVELSAMGNLVVEESHHYGNSHVDYSVLTVDTSNAWSALQEVCILSMLSSFRFSDCSWC